MKKAIVCLAFALCAAFSWGDVITNYVYVVSNIYNQTFTERVITNKVQNTHFEYYITNNVYTVTNRTILVSQTNLNVNVINTNFGPWIARCEQAATDAAESVSSARTYASNAASSASTAASRASAAASSAASAASSAAQAQSAANNGLANINARIQWFDQHSGETITQVNLVSNVNVTVAQTVVNNTFDAVPYNPDSNLQVNLNDFAMMAKGGTNNTYTISAPSGCRNDSGNSIGIGSFVMRFSKFELMDDGTGKFWYSSPYDTGTPYQGNGHTWRFEWAYWYQGVWHVAIRQRRYLSGVVTEDQVFDMTLSAVYPGSATGTFSNRPSNTWSPSNSSFGKLTGRTYSDAFGYVARMAIRDQVTDAANAARDAAKAYADELAALLGVRVDALDAGATSNGVTVASLSDRIGSLESMSAAFDDATNRLAAIESGSPHVYEHGGTTYSRITVYTTETANGKVSAVPTSSSSYAAASYTVTPAYRYPTTTASTWTFVPAYVDTDANGLRLQYVPTTIHAIKYSSSSTRYLVPEYLYWQNGYVYMKIKTYVNDVYDDGYVIGRVADANFPNNYSTSKTISKQSGNSWSSSNVGTIVGASTVSPAGTLLWFPASVSPSYVPTISWMMTGK